MGSRFWGVPVLGLSLPAQGSHPCPLGGGKPQKEETPQNGNRGTPKAGKTLQKQGEHPKNGEGVPKMGTGTPLPRGHLSPGGDPGVPGATQPRVELAWAMKAHQHAEVYFNLISSVEPKFLKLTQVDERIYEEFRRTFRNLRVDVLDPEELKSEAAKEKWRPFCLSFEGLVEDFSYGAKAWGGYSGISSQGRG
ncbi:protein PBDC1 isoform 2-T2 [Passerculus sandwichensis]